MALMLMRKSPTGLRNRAMVQIWRLVAQHKASLPIVTAVHPIPDVCLSEVHVRIDRDRAGRTTLVRKACEWFATGSETGGPSVAGRARRMNGWRHAWLRGCNRFATRICILTLMS